MAAYILEPGSSGNNVSSPHKGSLDLGASTSILVVAYLALDDWTPASATTFISVWGANAANGMFRCQVNATGTMTFSASVGGTGGNGSTTTVLPTAAGLSNGDGVWVWYMWQASDGTCDFKYSLDPPETDPLAVTWTTIQSNRSSGVSGTLTTSTAPMMVGGYDTSGGQLPLAGKVYRVVVYTNDLGSGSISTASYITDATVLIDCDPNQYSGSGSTFSSGGDTWTINGTATVEGAGGGTEEIADTDTGAGTEGTVDIQVALSATDSGTGTDTGSIEAALSGTDTGTGTDDGSVGSPIDGDPDAGSGTDTGSVAASLPGADTGLGTEASSIAATLSDTDSGAGSEGGPSIAFSATDSGLATEGFSIVVSLSASDVGAGTEAFSILAALSGSDSGTDSEDGNVLEGVDQIVDTDSGVGTDSFVSLVASLSDLDDGDGLDDGYLSYKELSDSDSAVALDVRHPLRKQVKKLTLLQATLKRSSVAREGRNHQHREEDNGFV